MICNCCNQAEFLNKVITITCLAIDFCMETFYNSQFRKIIATVRKVKIEKLELVCLFKGNTIKHWEKVWNMFKADNKDTRKRPWGRSGVSIVNFERISHLFLVSLLSILSRYTFARNRNRKELNSWWWGNVKRYVRFGAICTI